MSVDLVQPPISAEIVQQHVARLAELLKSNRADGLLVFAESNILGFCGVPLAPSDRLVCGLINADAEVAIVVPGFEADIAASAPTGTRLFSWQEHESPYAALKDAAEALGIASGKIFLDGRTWLDTQVQITESLNQATCLPDLGLIETVRITKTPEEIKAITAACEHTGQIYRLVGERLQPGISEMNLARDVLDTLRRRGLEPVGDLIQGGESGSVPHQRTGTRVFREGDAVIVDFVCRREGYLGDMTRTFGVGHVSDEIRQAYEAVKAAQRAGIEAIQPGVECQSVDAAARQVIEDAGFGEYFVHRLGHGIGLDIHEAPYLVRGNRRMLENGMCVTVEPGIYVPGRFGIRIEDVVAVTPNGHQILSKSVPTNVSPAFRN